MSWSYFFINGTILYKKYLFILCHTTRGYVDLSFILTPHICSSQGCLLYLRVSHKQNLFWSVLNEFSGSALCMPREWVEYPFLAMTELYGVEYPFLAMTELYLFHLAIHNIIWYISEIFLFKQSVLFHFS